MSVRHSIGIKLLQKQVITNHTSLRRYPMIDTARLGDDTPKLKTEGVRYSSRFHTVQTDNPVFGTGPKNVDKMENPKNVPVSTRVFRHKSLEFTTIS